MVVLIFLIVSPNCTKFGSVVFGYLHAAPFTSPKCQKSRKIVQSLTTRGNREYSINGVVAETTYFCVSIEFTTFQEQDIFSEPKSQDGKAIKTLE